MGDVNNVKVIPSLDWVELRKDLNTDFYPESNLQKAKRKCMENPLVPVGLMVTVGALSYGLYSFFQGKKQTQQYMMRLRVGAQLFTVLAATAGTFLNANKNKSK